MVTKALQWQRRDCIFIVNESRHQNKRCLRLCDLQRIKIWALSFKTDGRFTLVVWV